jgi:uncharacterized protein (UPF0548 family)
MRIVLASHIAASPWMNPARWTDRPAIVIDSDSRPRRWRRDHYHTTLATGAARTVVAERARAAVLAYRIFPPELMIAALPDMTVAPDQVIVQGFRLGLVGVIAATRVATVFDRRRSGSRRTGFSYLTLAGHPVHGAMTFAVIEDDRAEVARFEIDTVSQPGHWLTRLTPSLVRRQQQMAARAAIAHVRRLAESTER